MRTYPVSSLETRVLRLEKRNRTLLYLWVVTAALLVAAHTLPGLARDVVRAERYQLTDPAGTVRAELRLDAGTATLQLLDDAGNVRATLSEAAGRGARGPAGPSRSGDPVRVGAAGP